MLVVDVKKAHLMAPAARDVYIEIPGEDQVEKGDEGRCGKLVFSMYGTRDAAACWEAHYSKVLEDVGMVKGIVAPGVFYCSDRGIRLLVHCDDFVIVGNSKGLEKFQEVLQNRFEIISMQ